jgi:hypothetical protein
MIRDRLSSRVIHERLSVLADPHLHHRLASAYPKLFRDPALRKAAIVSTVIVTVAFWLAVIVAFMYGMVVSDLRHPVNASLGSSVVPHTQMVSGQRRPA